MFSLSASVRRHIVSLSLSVVATSALFLLMQHLIKSDESGYVEAAPPVKLKFDPQIPEPVDPPGPRELMPPPKVDTPPLVQIAKVVEGFNGSWGGEFIPPVATAPTPQINARADGGVMSLAMVAPQYPERAKRQGLEGYVIVEFTVDSRGAVRNPVVVEAKPQGVFDRYAIAAIERSKFRPRVEGGQATAVNGVRKRLTFELEN